MSDPWYLLAATGIAAGITWTLRATPFLVVGRLRRMPVVEYLGERRPVGVMPILVLYTLRDIDLGALPSTVPTLAALVVTAALQLWRRNAVLSILVGTAAHVGLVTATS